MTSTVHVILLSRDLDGLLRVCLQHVGAAPDIAITVVDNASRWPCPSAMADAPAYRLIRFDQHCSFARACNLGARESAADFLLFLNNDVLLDRGALASMLAAFARHPRLAICGSRLIFPDRTIQHAGVVFGPGDIGPYHANRKQLAANVPRERERFQAVTGACLMIRREVFGSLGGFDEAYPFGLEDIDLCLRAGQAGHEIRCVQDTESLHFESMTPGRVELDPPSRALFMHRWKGRYAIDGNDA